MEPKYFTRAEIEEIQAKRLARDERLLKRIKKNLPELDKMLEGVNNEWGYEDGLYRFYHQSFKVYHLQADTLEMVKAFEALAPKYKNGTRRELNAWFLQIVKEGTGKEFQNSHNQDWLKHTRPIVEAYLHAKYFLEMICKSGHEMEHAENLLPSHWAATLYLFNMRL